MIFEKGLIMALTIKEIILEMNTQTAGNLSSKSDYLNGV